MDLQRFGSVFLLVVPFLEFVLKGNQSEPTVFFWGGEVPKTHEGHSAQVPSELLA